jgi:hypothetical protein
MAPFVGKGIIPLPTTRDIQGSPIYFYESAGNSPGRRLKRTFFSSRDKKSLSKSARI